jgi:hypothetical protein
LELVSEDSCTILVGKHSGNRPLERSRHVWKDTIKRDLKYIARDDVDPIFLAQDRIQCRALVSTVMNLPIS